MNYLASFWNLRLRPVDAILRYLKNGKTIKYQYIRILLANSVRIPADPLIEEGIDIALRVRKNIEDSSLIARPISQAPQTLYIAPDLINQNSITEPEDLLTFEHLSMHYTNGRYGYELIHSSGQQKNIRIKPRLITDDMIVLREAAIKKLGIVALPNYLCNDAVNSGELVPVLTDWHLPIGIMHMTYSHRRGILPAVRVLIDFLAEKLPNLAQQQF